MKLQIRKHLNRQIAPNKRAVSSVITTIILTGVLLIILLVATFVSANILNAQIVSTEFSQAKSNMLLLDSTIQDVALRPGSGGYVQFNNREGGIGIYQVDGTLTITVTNGTDSYTKTFDNLIQLTYRGGTLSTAVDQPLNGVQDVNVSVSQGLGYLREQQDDGAKIKLDYNRCRINPMGLIGTDTNLIQISFIHLEKGVTGSVGDANVQVYNNGTSTEVWEFSTSTGTPPPISITITYSSPTISQPLVGIFTDSNPPANSVIVFSETFVIVSIL